MIFINGHKVSEVICLCCFRRWIAARPAETHLIELECPYCRSQGATIETGETCVAADMIRKVAESK